MTGERRGPVGRASIHDALTVAVESAVGGHGGLLLLTGEPGIGKTTAARELCGRAEAAGADVVWAACWPDDPTAHGPWLTVLAALGDSAGPTADVLRGAEPHDGAAASAARAGAYELVVTTLVGKAHHRPLVIVIDDLHWADEGTVRLLTALRGRLPAAALLVVGTYRDAEVAASSPLAVLAQAADRIALSGLVTEEVDQLLVEALGHQPDPATVRDVRRRTGGNPFFVLQVGRLLAAGSDDALPAGAREVLRRRLDVLTEDVRTVLGAAATLGSPFRAATVAAIVQLDGAAVLAALDSAAAARVVERLHSAGDWGFVHDLFRAAVLDALPTASAATLHLAAGTVLADDGAEPAIVAHHLLAAATGPDPVAASWSVKAAEQALGSLAWEEAVDHAQRALAAMPSQPSGPDATAARTECLLVLGRARLLAGDEPGAGDAFADAARLARELGSVELLAQAALGFAADLAGFEIHLFEQRQIDLLEEAASSLAESSHPSSHALRARVLARLSVALSFTASTERRLALAEQAVALARSVGEPLVLAGALAAHCDAIAGPDDVERRLAESTEVIELAGAAGDGGLELLGRRLRFVALLELGDVFGVEKEAAAFGRRADIMANPLYSWYIPLWRGMWLVAGGDFAGAEAAIDEVRVIGQRAGSTNAPMLASVLRCEMLYETGRATELITMFDVMRGELDELYDAPQALGSFARSYLAAGLEPEARAMMDRLHAFGVDALPRDAELLPALAISLQVAVALDHPVLPSLVAAAEPYADRIAFEGIGAGLHGCLSGPLALAHSALGDHDRAVALGRRALEANRATGALVRAHSQRVLAGALTARARADDAAEAAALAGAAEAVFTSLGVEPPAPRTVAGSRVTSPSAAGPGGTADAELRRDGEVWHIAYGGHESIVRHAKGVADLALLLAHPNREVHVTELEALPPSVAKAARQSGRDEVLDRRAVAEYRDRLAELEADIAEAEAANDAGRSDRARVERDFIVDELTASFGLGGRARATGPDPVERLRKAVTARVRDAIRRIEAVHPALGRHLTNSIRTGTFCSYAPERPVIWRCETRTGGPQI